MRASSLIAFGFAVAVASCASSPAMRAAERGDVASLRAEIGAREKAGKLSNADAAKIARAVVAWDLAHADAKDARARVGDVRSCAAEVDDALADRAKIHDAAGGEAALARADAKMLSASDARDAMNDPIDAWCAVGARGLVRERDDDARAKALVDPAPIVRRAAMHASIDAARDRDGELDVAPLAEAARSDPEPLLRSDAVRALGSLRPPAADAAFRALRDLWATSDDPMKEDIARAYASPGLRDAGGAGELRAILAAGKGPAAIEAAGAVLRFPARDAEIDASATSLLARTIDASGKASLRDRLHAIALAPTTPGPILDALRASSKADDPKVRVAVLARLASVDADRAASIAALEALAGDRDHPPIASRARISLASAGDVRVQAWLESDLAASDPFVRLGAASALAALGREARAAPLLADADPSVRGRAACVILLAARTRR